MDVPLDISALLVEDLHVRLDVSEVLVPAAGVDDEVYVLVSDLGDDGIVDGAAFLVGEDGERAGAVRGGVYGTAAVAHKRRAAACGRRRARRQRGGQGWRGRRVDGAVARDGAAVARTAARDGERRRTGTERRRGRGPGTGSGGGGPPRRRG